MTLPDASPLLHLATPDGARASVALDGAHVISWRPAGEMEDRLFLSNRTAMGEGVSIRGGIPVIFPQFAAEGPLPRHGFARTMRWTMAPTPAVAPGEAALALTLADSPATRAIWPARFLATITVRIGGPRLSVELAVENRGEAPLAFTAALHTYLRVDDVARATLEGLRDVRFRESSAPGVLRTDDRDLLRPAGELDRVYVDVPRALHLREPGRALEISQSGFLDVVVWNPGPAKAAALADMEPGGERRMLCVEAAAVQRPIVLPAGPGRASNWSGTQELKVVG